MNFSHGSLIPDCMGCRLYNLVLPQNGWRTPTLSTVHARSRHKSRCTYIRTNTILHSCRWSVYDFKKSDLLYFITHNSLFWNLYFTFALFTFSIYLYDLHRFVDIYRYLLFLLLRLLRPWLLFLFTYASSPFLLLSFFRSFLFALLFVFSFICSTSYLSNINKYLLLFKNYPKKIKHENYCILFPRVIRRISVF